jgi:hypothetical protein
VALPELPAYELPLHEPEPPEGSLDRRGLFRRGRALFQAGELARALPYLSALNELDPDHVGVCWMLASSYDRLSLTREAVALLPCLESTDREHYERVRSLIESLLRSGLHEIEFRQAVSDSFMASYDPRGSGAETVGRILDVLERGRASIERRTGLKARRRIAVVIYEEGQFGESTGAPHWAKGFFDGKIRAPIADAERYPDRFDTMLVHEYAHALLHEKGGARIPAWVHEGLANLLARQDLDARALRARLEQEPPLGLDALTPSFRELPEELVGLAYLQSYWMMRDLTNERGFAPWLALLDGLERDPALSFDAAFHATHDEWPDRFLDRWVDAQRP